MNEEVELFGIIYEVLDLVREFSQVVVNCDCSDQVIDQLFKVDMSFDAKNQHADDALVAYCPFIACSNKFTLVLVCFSLSTAQLV